MHQAPSTYASQIAMNPQFPEHEHLNCPRCHSSNTKFCYYNNYNLSQPRHFCKNCRRYWTKGGTLRNIPVGGGTRKSTKRSSNANKRSANSSSPTSPVAAPPPPPAQPKREPSGVLGFGNNQPDEGGGNSSSRFGTFLMDGLRPNPADVSQNNRLIQTPASDVFLINYLSVNNDKNQSGSGGGGGRGGGESSCWSGGLNGWPDRSNFPSGSSLH